MFSENPNLISFDEKIFIYRNFIPAEMVDKITKIADEAVGGGSFTDHKNPWYRERFSPHIPELFDVWKLISEFISPSHVIHPMLNLIIMREGEEMFVHEDSPGENNEEMLTVDDMWSSCCVLDYGVIAYFGDWDGGEVFYPELGIEISPRPGDLVIHGATSRWKHGVKPVTRGIRYAFSNFSMKTEKNPGSFYNYGTPEFLNQVSEKGLGNWAKPLFENNRTYIPFE